MWLLALLSACGEELTTDSGRVRVVFADLYVDPLTSMDRTHPVLLGTRLCPTLSIDGVDVTAQYTLPEGGCFTADTIGPLVLAFNDETLTLEVVGDVSAEVYAWPEDWAETTLTGDFPADWRWDGGTLLRVAVGGTFDVPVVLRHDGVAVGWNPSAASWAAVGLGRPPVLVPGVDGAARVTPIEATDATLSLTVGEATWTVVQLRGVARADIDRIELVAAMDGDVPAGARAIAWSGDHMVLGAPFTWTTPDGLTVTPAGTLPGQDYASFSGACAGGSATVAVSLDSLRATADLAWAGGEGSCPEPCGCGSARGAPALLFLLAIVSVRRRSALMLLAGCGPEAAIHTTRDLGPLRWDDAVSSRDGGYSTGAGDQSIWVFGDTILQGTETTWRNNTLAVTSDLDASDGIYPFEETVDEAGAPIEFLPMTEEEIAFEAAHNGPDCGDTCEGIALWPGAPVWDGERVLMFYTKYTQRPGFLNVTSIGSSVAVWEEGVATRPEVRPGEAEPTLLFDDVGLAAASVLEGRTLYAFVSLGELHDLALCRVDVAEVLDPDAWEFWDGAGWVDNPDDLAALFFGSEILSVHFNPWLDRYVAIYSEAWGTGLELRTASALTGPWSAAARIHTFDVPSEDTWVYSGLAHAELMRDGGRFDYATAYFDSDGTMRLVEIEYR